MRQQVVLVMFVVTWFLLGVRIMHWIRESGLWRGEIDSGTAATSVATFYDGDGNPLVGGSIYVYDKGTTRMAVSYRSFTLASEPGNVNPNPVPLNWLGQATRIYLADGEYDIVPVDKHGRRLDPITIGMAK